MKTIRILVATAIIVLVPMLTATAARATVTGPCTASGTINKTTYRADQASVEIPRKGAVHWTGAVPGSGRRNINGKITAGQFAGLTWAGSAAYGLDPGSCTTTPLGLASIQLLKGTKLTIS